MDMGKGCGAKKKMAVPYADGGYVHPLSIRGVMNSAKKLFEQAPEENITQKFARKDAELKAKHPELFKKDTTEPVQKPEQSPISVVNTIRNRNEQIDKAAKGYKDGGQIKAGIIKGPGTGTSDSIKGKMENGSFVMPKDTTDVMVSNGETNFTPEMVQSVGAAALMAAKELTHTPVGKQNATQFADGGYVEEKKKNNFGDAAAVNQNPLVSQIPTGGHQAPQGNPVTGTEFTRNVGNTINALPGISPVLTGANALLGASKAGQALTSGAAGVGSVAQTIAPYAVPTAGAVGLGIASSSPERQVQQPAAIQQVTPAPVAASPQPATTTAVVAVPSAVESVPNNQVTRIGNSYTGAPNIAGNVQINNPRGGGISPQNQQAAQALSDKSAAGSLAGAPIQSGGGVNFGTGGSDYQRRLDRKNAETGASSILDTPSRKTARDTLRAMSAEDLANINAQSSQNIANINAETQRVGYGIQAQNNLATQQNAATRLGIDRNNATLTNKQTEQQIGVTKQMQDLQARLLTAKPEERSLIEDNLRALQGKYEKTVPDKFTVVPGGTDELGNKQASRVFNNQTGQFIDASPPAKTNFEAGKIYTDAKGNKATWNGQAFVPVK